MERWLSELDAIFKEYRENVLPLTEGEDYRAAGGKAKELRSRVLDVWKIIPEPTQAACISYLVGLSGSLSLLGDYCTEDKNRRENIIFAKHDIEKHIKSLKSECFLDED
jgi:hypothetical protein